MRCCKPPLYVQGLRQPFVYLHDSCLVSGPIAVVWCAPYGDDRLVEHELEPLHRELVGTRDKVDGVVVREDLRNVGAEEEACTARRETAASYIYKEIGGRRRMGDGYVPSGSDHSKSHIGPSCGTSCFRSIARIYPKT